VRELPGFSLNYNIALIKFVESDKAAEILEEYAKMRKRRPDLFATFDFVGEEVKLKPIEY